MAKIRSRFRNMPVLATLLLLTTTFLIVAMLVIEVERTLLQNGQYAIAFRYSDIVEGFNGIKVWGTNVAYILSTQDSTLCSFTNCFFGYYPLSHTLSACLQQVSFSTVPK